MINKVILVGHLGTEPEVRTFQSGDRVINMSLATSESWKDKETGEKKTKTEWHKVVVLNKHLVDICEKYLKKGNMIYVEGTLRTRSYDKDGETRYITEVVLPPFGGVMTMLGGQNTQENQNVEENNQQDILDDDICF